MWVWWAWVFAWGNFLFGREDSRGKGGVKEEGRWEGNGMKGMGGKDFCEWPGAFVWFDSPEAPPEVKSGSGQSFFLGRVKSLAVRAPQGVEFREPPPPSGGLGTDLEALWYESAGAFFSRFS